MPGSRDALNGSAGQYAAALQADELGETIEVGAKLVDGRFGMGAPRTPPKATVTVVAASPSGNAVREGTVEIDCGGDIRRGRLDEPVPVAGGKCTITVHPEPGYGDASKVVEIPIGSATRASVEVAPYTRGLGKLEIGRLPKGTSLADVSIDGVRIRDRVVEVSLGRHTLELNNEFFQYKQSFEVEHASQGVDIDISPTFGVTSIDLDELVNASAIRLEGGLRFFQPSPNGERFSRFMVRGRRPGRVTVSGVDAQVPIVVGQFVSFRFPKPSQLTTPDAGVIPPTPVRGKELCDLLAEVLKSYGLTCIPPRESALILFSREASISSFGIGAFSGAAIASAQSVGSLSASTHVSLLVGSKQTVSLGQFYPWVPGTRLAIEEGGELDVELNVEFLALYSFDPDSFRRLLKPPPKSSLPTVDRETAAQLCAPGTRVATAILGAFPTLTIRSKRGVRLETTPFWADVTLDGPNTIQMKSKALFVFGAQWRNSPEWLGELCNNAPCGELSQRCCPNRACGTELTCVNGTCLSKARALPRAGDPCSRYHCTDSVVWSQGPEDHGGELTRNPSQQTSVIDEYAEVGPSYCGRSEGPAEGIVGREIERVRFEIDAEDEGTTCAGEFVSEHQANCRVRVHFKSERAGASVRCSIVIWGNDHSRPL